MSKIKHNNLQKSQGKVKTYTQTSKTLPKSKENKLKTNLNKKGIKSRQNKMIPIKLLILIIKKVNYQKTLVLLIIVNTRKRFV